jgi:hypothetical protein
MSAHNSLHGLDCQSIGSVMNSVLTSSVINRGLDCQSIGSVMNSVLIWSVINRGLDWQSIGCQHAIHYTTNRLGI